MTILYLWTVIVMTCNGQGACYNERVKHDWRPIGEYATVVACEKARNKLGVATDDRSRCVEKN